MDYSVLVQQPLSMFKWWSIGGFHGLLRSPPSFASPASRLGPLAAHPSTGRFRPRSCPFGFESPFGFITQEETGCLLPVSSCEWSIGGSNPRNDMFLHINIISFLAQISMFLAFFTCAVLPSIVVLYRIISPNFVGVIVGRCLQYYIKKL